MIQPGTVIKGFVVREHIGSGGFGDVYRVRDQRTNRAFALKLARSSLSGHRNRQQVLESFVNEVSMVSLLHGNDAIAGIYRSILYRNKTGDYLGIIMELVQGTPLDVHIYNKGKLVEEQAVPLFLQIVEAVGHAHARGILHRDIKPGNIMVLPHKTTVVAGRATHPIKMLDFGLAKTMEQASAVESLSGVSLPYMAPERLVHGGRIDIRTDIYSLGATLYEMLTGNQPFQVTSFPQALSMIPTVRPPSIRASYAYHPAWLDAVVQQSMAKAPDDRFADCACFARALASQGAAPPIGRPGASRIPPPIASRRPPPAPPREAPSPGAVGGPASTEGLPPGAAPAGWDGGLPGAEGPFLAWFLGGVLGVSGVFPPPGAGVVPSTVARRAVAGLIDLGVLLCLNVLVPRIALVVVQANVLPAVVFLACFLYAAGCEALWGATLGKACAGLRVIPMHRGGNWRVGHMQSGFRTVFKYPLLLVLPLQYVPWDRVGVSFPWVAILLAAAQAAVSLLDVACIRGTKAGLSLHDALARTLVARRLSPGRAAHR